MKKLLLSLLLSILSISSSSANGGVGGSAGGGGVKPELERVINFHNYGGINLNHRQLELTTDNISYYDKDKVLNVGKISIINGEIRFNINEIEEVTLKDGSVVKTWELLELIGK